MAETIKEYLNLEGLEHYDGKIRRRSPWEVEQLAKLDALRQWLEKELK